MTLQPEFAQVQMKIDLGPEIDADTLDATTRSLRSEVAPLGIARLVSAGNPPSGTRSVEAVTIGVLALATLPKALPELIRFLKDWCLRAEKRMVEMTINQPDGTSITIKLNGDTSPERLREIISAL